MKRSIIYILPLTFLLLSCAASRISFDVLAPAPNYIPQSIQSIAIIDRSLPENADLNKLEGILTGEGLEQDRLSTQIVLDGLNRSLGNSSRYDVIRTTELMKGSGSGSVFPAPLSWEAVNELCQKYEVDAIVSLETYDSDFIVTSGTRPGGRLFEFYAKGVATVNCGFRMYDPVTTSIVDEFHYSHARTWDAGGLSIIAAAEALLNKNAAIREASFDAGMVYGQRITPAWFMVSRDYFRKAKNSYDLEEGARMMQLNDWDKAIAALERGVESSNRKDRGRSAHNLAVVQEILGNLEQAKEWTTVAWGRYREKKSRDYGYILTRRIQEQGILDYQLNRD
ncbi:MAG TPA: DUF6340 family protein [Bacteroidales bacterium]|nr:DUF6340 family protein [Bacteroidales bacterium]